QKTGVNPPTDYCTSAALPLRVGLSVAAARIASASSTVRSSSGNGLVKNIRHAFLVLIAGK
ncbi:hypothetical protein Tco_0376277, partial [Tanacetum coccineum]